MLRTRLTTFAVLTVALAFSAVALLPGEADAWPPPPTKRSNHVPNVGELAQEEQPLGDMWTFFCPAGGYVVASVDTKDDTDLGTSNIDPILELLDGNGAEIAFGDDENTCTYPPVCGYDCPALRDANDNPNVACGDLGSSGLHSLIVRDYGTAENTGDHCDGGGGYELTVDVFDASGNQLSQEDVALGGGPSRGVPDWAVVEGKAPVGPALDDENVPERSPARGKGHLVIPPIVPPVIPPIVPPKLPGLP
jgi:hypothetical protein